MLLFSFSVVMCYLFCDTSPSEHKIIVAYHSSNCRLVVEISHWTTIKPNRRDNRLCHFALAMYFKMRHILDWNFLFITPLKILIFFLISEDSIVQSQVFRRT